METIHFYKSLSFNNIKIVKLLNGYVNINNIKFEINDKNKIYGIHYLQLISKNIEMVKIFFSLDWD